MHLGLLDDAYKVIYGRWFKFRTDGPWRVIEEKNSQNILCLSTKVLNTPIKALNTTLIN